MTVDERSTDPAGTLATLRDAIGEVDARLVALIAERVRLARAVGAAKRALGRPTIDPSREAAVVRHAGELARAASLDDGEVREIFWRLIALSRRAQREDDGSRP
jgi:chorismate mutase